MILGDRVRNGYIFLLIVLYQMSHLFLGIKLYTKCYIFFLVLLFLYYLLDILNFKDRKFEARDVVYSLIINFIVFGLDFYSKLDYKLILSVILFSIFQILLRKAFIKRSLNIFRILVIDNGKYLEKIVKVIDKNLKYNYVGYISDNEFQGKNYLGKVSNITEIIKRKKINEIIFTKKNQIKNYSDLIVKAKLSGIKVIDYINFLELVEGKVDVDEINSMWVLFSSGFENFSNIIQKRSKRMFDIIISLIFLIISSPFILFIFFLVKLDGGPAFFKQKRIGYLGKEFEIIKFRSMKVHDPDKFSKYPCENDVRIGKIGKFIRKNRLDELPQLINVFKGEMSFVGPRPEWNELGSDYEKKIKNYELRYTVRPGITGWAQTMYCYSCSLGEAKQKLGYDLFYVKHQDLILDIVILLKTFKIILSEKGR